jgi:hypothetical protein
MGKTIKADRKTTKIPTKHRRLITRERRKIDKRILNESLRLLSELELAADSGNTPRVAKIERILKRNSRKADVPVLG